MTLAGAFLHRSRHGTVLYFRRRVPDDVREVLGRRHIYRSLGTTDKRRATVLARLYAVTTDELFERIRAMKKKGGTSDEPFRVGLEVLFVEDKATGKRELRIKSDPDKPGDNESAVATAQAFAAALTSDLPFRAAPPPASVRPPDNTAHASNLTLQTAVDRFLDEADLKPRTKKAYSTGLLNVALAYFAANRAIESITQRDIAAFAKKIDTFERSFSTKEGYLSALSSLGSWCRRQGYIHEGWTCTGLLRKPAARPDTDDRDAIMGTKLLSWFKTISRMPVICAN